MPLRSDIKKVLVIGSGPIVIGQAAEFDYAGTQACKALKEEGLEVVLVNSNPATIMTDKNMADKIYIEPLTVQVLKNIINIEKPDSILPTLGGQVGLNLAMELSECGFLEETGVKLLGTTPLTIKKAEDRQTFKDTMEKINQPCIPSKVVENVEDALEFATQIGLPLVIRPAYTMGGTGGGIAYTMDELQEIATNGLRASRVTQILVEKCISGWKEIEFEAMRDAKGNKITICSMENIDPVGVHTGDSIVVAPAQTMSAKEFAMMRQAALDILEELGIEGGCNVQFALEPGSFEYAVIEVNPRLSRSSALASKATGFPIARVASKIAVGYTLNEIPNAVTKSTFACFEPAVDYTVVKFPKWPFDKFVKAKRTLGTQMKATGEVMSIGSTLENALMKAVRSLELNLNSFVLPKLKVLPKREIEKRLLQVDDERFFVVAEAIRRGISIEEIAKITTIDIFFIQKIANVVDMEGVLEHKELSVDILREAKRMGFVDKVIAELSGKTQEQVRQLRMDYKILPTYKKVDTCAGEFDAQTPYYYSTYDRVNEAVRSDKKKILVIGSGPIRIGQGIEFDYCSVHSVWALKQMGYETIIANNNPETVSTDFDTSDKLYFEPLTPEDVQAIIENEQPEGVIVQFGGQTAIKLTKFIDSLGVKIFGTTAESTDAAEDRELFDAILEKCGVPRPQGTTVFTHEEAIAAAGELGYPVLLRPSYVLGGQGMEIAYSDKDVREFMDIITLVKQEHPILIDKYMMGKELEVDAICDGESLLIPGIMEHLERAGVHSGDSISVYPTQSIAQKHKDTIVDYTIRLARELGVVGLINIQFVLYQDAVYVIEVNPRSSRTVPYISKVTNIPMVNLATRAVLGEKIGDMGFGTGLYKESDYVAIKVPVFSFEKLHNVDTSLGPEMKSTGEVLGISKTFSEALYKGILASGIRIKKSGIILATVCDADKEELAELVSGYEKCGYRIISTAGTAKYLSERGINAQVVHKIEEGTPNILDLIDSGEVALVINTPTRGRAPERDGFQIRRKAVEHSVPCVTSLDTARAVLDTLQHGANEADLTMVDITKV